MAAIFSGTVSVPESGPSWLAPPDRSISQMHVSRLRTHALGYLRSRLLDLEGTRAHAGPASAPQPLKGRASATSANRLYGGRRAWSCVSFAIS
jgi:hypothetical protein